MKREVGLMIGVSKQYSANVFSQLSVWLDVVTHAIVYKALLRCEVVTHTPSVSCNHSIRRPGGHLLKKRMVQIESNAHAADAD